MSVPAALVPHAEPLPPNAWALGTVRNLHASANPPSDFVGVLGAAQVVAVPSAVPSITAIPLPIPPLPIPVLQMPMLIEPTQPLQAPPTGQSATSRLDTIDGVFPAIASGSSGCKQSGLPPGGPPDDPDDGDPEKRKREKEIDAKRKGVFTIDSAALRGAKRRYRGRMKCEIERFERGTDLTIKDWINQIKNYFTIGQVPFDAFVGFMLMKIVPKHLNEINQYQSLGYLEFREKLVEVFEKSDMATAYLNALSSLSQTREESISDYMLRARLLILKAHPNLAHSDRERILVTRFLIGLYDLILAASLAVARIQYAADAVGLAAEGEAMRYNQRSRRSNLNLLQEGELVEDLDDSPGADL